MPIARRLPDDTVEAMDALLATDLRPYQRERAQALRLLALGRTNLDVAEIFGKHENTIAKWRRAYCERGDESVTEQPRGGRRNQLMDEDAERAFVQGFIEAAERGELVTVSMVHQALVDKTGHTPWMSTTYEMLERHGWRKITPRPAHPESDAERREAFKQTSRR